MPTILREMIMTETGKCWRCYGSGKIYESITALQSRYNKCIRCNGTGIVEKKEIGVEQKRN